jgi:hypothetical protein
MATIPDSKMIFDRVDADSIFDLRFLPGRSGGEIGMDSYRLFAETDGAGPAYVPHARTVSSAGKTAR